MTDRYPHNEFVYHDGFYEQHEREHVIVHKDIETQYTFIGKRDLVSDTVFVVTPDGDSRSPQEHDCKLTMAVSKFIAGFMIWDYKRMNGFNGFDCIRWRIINAETLRRACDDEPEYTNADVYARLQQLTEEA